jgi:hypothetical protein
VPPNLPDPYHGNVLRNFPTTLAHYCPGSTCRAATPSFSSEFVALANQIEAKPLTGRVLQADGKSIVRHMNGEDLLNFSVDADLNPGLAAELPAAVHAARQGDPLPLLRLYDLDIRFQVTAAENLSFGLYAATTCADGLFPWSPTTPVADRPALLQAAIAALPAGTLGPFGSWAGTLGTAGFCEDWPTPAGGTPLGAGPLPDVPMLAITGGLDLRTPVESAAQIVAQFPQGHLLVAPGTGHSVLTQDFSFCTQRAVASWILTGTIRASCPRPNPLIAVVPAFVTKLAALPGKADAGKTIAAAQRTIRDAEGAWFTAAGFGSNAPVAGLYGGKIVQRSNGFDLVGYSSVPGVRLTGKLTVAQFHLPLQFNGSVTVAGPVTGKLTLAKDVLRGTVGGRKVG